MQVALCRIVLTSGLLCALMAPCCTFAQDRAPVAHWSFDKAQGEVTQDSVTKIGDKVEGYAKYVPGVSGTGLRFDG